MTRRVLGFLLLIFVLGVAVAQGTVTGTFSITLDPGNQAQLQFRPSVAGPVAIETNRFSAATVRLSLFVEGNSEPIAKTEGPAPLKLGLERVLENTAYTLQINNISTTRAQGNVNITYPMVFCSEAAVEFKITFAYADRAQPIETDHCRIYLAVLRSLPDPLPQGITRVEQVPPQGGIAGTYSPGTLPRIRIFGLQIGADLARVFFHEVGHHIQFKHFNSDQEKRWTELHKQSGNESSAYARLYGKNNEFEDWASVFEAYTRDAVFEIDSTRKASEPGSPILIEKYKFATALLKHERDGSSRTYVFRTDRLGPEGAVINRASVPMSDDGLPVTSGDIIWEQF